MQALVMIESVSIVTLQQLLTGLGNDYVDLRTHQIANA